MECDRDLCQIALHNDFSCEECEAMRRDEFPIIDKHVENEKNALIDRVLEIIDRYYLWHLDESGNYVTVGEEIRQAVLALKGGE